MSGGSSKTMVLEGRYELRPLASGGMGEVWEGHDTRLDREVAVKFLRFPDGVHDEQLVRRFIRESRITARLEHPGVPAVFDRGTHEGRPYLVMQRVHGISVSDLIAEEGELPVGWAAAIAAQVCAVLTAAHGASLVHRDLKPSNLMLEPEGTVKVLDFGLAVALDRNDFSQITRTGQTLGTPAYMAPEQVAVGMSTPQSDLYALGCVLHQMLTGQQPFTGSTAYATMNKQVSEPPQSVRVHRPEVPAAFADLVLQLLAKKPEDRPGSAQEVYQRLLPFTSDLGPLPGPFPSPQLPGPTRMYATVVSRVFGRGAAAVPGRPGKETATASFPKPPRPRPAPSAPGFDRSDLSRLRKQALDLASESRYSQAADVLASAVGIAEQAFGSLDADVMDLRRHLAEALFDGGDYRRAAPVFAVLAAYLAERDGPDGELVFRYRLREATCHALVGDAKEALELMRRLLSDEQRVYGPGDPRVLELRRQIGLVQLSSGQHEQAAQTLRPLLVDLIRLHGPDHPQVSGVRALLEQAERTP
ncbi:serine/threonine-protein kinase [Thermobifida cellulosilytica]|uniref:non-specific serine/threonine protein kinase n=1 Tax=Thermobifida cellulosilytica TB100 TaxID=665004 RepID=A0A147KGU9_THECS|nr:serine/threonine-protein kinase [Thermobifida cellulosilytica]KUP96512.1 serine/threonine protein kinase [Thermobifida cellulosilytica TB100]